MRKCQSSFGLDRAGFFQRFVSAVLIDRFQAAGGDAHANELFQLRHPNAVLAEVGHEKARDILGDVPTDAAFFLGHTAAMNHAAARGFGTGNNANSRHNLGTGRKTCRACGDCQAIYLRSFEQTSRLMVNTISQLNRPAVD